MSCALHTASYRRSPACLRTPNAPGSTSAHSGKSADERFQIAGPDPAASIDLHGRQRARRDQLVDLRSAHAQPGGNLWSSPVKWCMTRDPSLGQAVMVCSSSTSWLVVSVV